MEIPAPLISRSVSVSDGPISRSRSTFRDASYPRDVCKSLSSAQDNVGTSGGRTSTSMLTQVAYAILDQHHAFTEEGLMRYVAENYPEVSQAERRPLVIGVVAGAKRATRLQVSVNKNAGSSDPSRRLVATNGDSTLSFWNYGFRYSARPNTSCASSGTSAVNPLPSCSSEATTLGVPTRSASEAFIPMTLTISDTDFDAVYASMFQSVIAPGRSNGSPSSCPLITDENANDTVDAMDKTLPADNMRAFHQLPEQTPVDLTRIVRIQITEENRRMAQAAFPAKQGEKQLSIPSTPERQAGQQSEVPEGQAGQQKPTQSALEGQGGQRSPKQTASDTQADVNRVPDSRQVPGSTSQGSSISTDRLRQFLNSDAELREEASGSQTEPKSSQQKGVESQGEQESSKQKAKERPDAELREKASESHTEPKSSKQTGVESQGEQKSSKQKAKERPDAVLREEASESQTEPKSSQLKGVESQGEQKSSKPKA